MRICESASRAIDRDEFEGDLLRDDHHDLLQLGLGTERDKPELAAGILGGEIGGFIERARGPWVEDGGENHFVLNRWPRCGLEGLQWVWDNSCANDDVEWSWHG